MSHDPQVQPSSNPCRRVLIVGGVAGGASCAARLRRLDESCEIIIFDRGPYVSFANCGLPYYVGNVIADERKLLVSSGEMFRATSSFTSTASHSNGSGKVCSYDSTAGGIQP
jgi:hypothetical protein